MRPNVTERSGASLLGVMPPSVTILVTSYNQAEFVEECVISALRQTEPCAVIVVDDGSTDGSPEIAQACGVEVHRLAHRGALLTFRSAVDLVETAFYCLLNADDALEPNYVAETLPYMADPSVGFVYTGWRNVGALDRIVPARRFDARELLFGNYVHAASLTRKQAYDSVGGYDLAFSDFYEDWALWLRMSQSGWQGHPVDKPLLRYRRHAAPSRNPTSPWALQRARWRMALRHPGWYGPAGFRRLAASSAKTAVRHSLNRVLASIRRSA